MNSRILTALVLAAALLWNPTASRAQDATICGSAPPVSDEKLTGDIKGKAQFLSRFIGGAELSGKIETSRTEIFSEYPEAETSRWNSFFQFQVCVLVMSDRSKTPAQKLDALKEVQREFSKPLVKKVTVIIRSGNKFIDNRRFGSVDGSLGFLELKIDGRRVTKQSLDRPFGSHKVTLKVGEHDFEFVGKIFARSAYPRILEDNCSGTFTVEESGEFTPFVVIEGIDMYGKFVSCSLDPA